MAPLRRKADHHYYGKLACCGLFLRKSGDSKPRRSPFCCRVLEICVAGFFGRQQPVLDVDDPIGEFEQPRIMRYHQNLAIPLFGDGGQYRHDRVPVGRIERSSGFVSEHDRGSATMARAIATRCCSPPLS